MKSLVAVDWGTSSFRLLHLNAENGEVVGRLSSKDGVAKFDGAGFESYLYHQIQCVSEDLVNSPIIMCGMVGSSIGWQNAAYVDCPIEPAVLSSQLARVDDTELDAVIVPGLRAQSRLDQPDMMRGEETQLVGWLASHQKSCQEKRLVCLPGTHSKWVEIKENRINNFSTAFTGELFASLNNASILVDGEQEDNEDAFLSGLEASQKTPSLLHLLFSTRSRMLENLQAKSHCRSYLSGLLIGSEINSSVNLWAGYGAVDLIGDPTLTQLYSKALKLYGIQAEAFNGENMSSKGLWSLYQQASQ